MAGGPGTLRGIATLAADDVATLRAKPPVAGWTAFEGMAAELELVAGARHSSAITTTRSSAALALLHPCRSASAHS